MEHQEGASSKRKRKISADGMDSLLSEQLYQRHQDFDREFLKKDFGFVLEGKGKSSNRIYKRNHKCLVEDCSKSFTSFRTKSFSRHLRRCHTLIDALNALPLSDGSSFFICNHRYQALECVLQALRYGIQNALSISRKSMVDIKIPGVDETVGRTILSYFSSYGSLRSWSVDSETNSFPL